MNRSMNGNSNIHHDSDHSYIIIHKTRIVPQQRRSRITSSPPPPPPRGEISSTVERPPSPQQVQDIHRLHRHRLVGVLNEALLITTPTGTVLRGSNGRTRSKGIYNGLQ